MSQILPPGTIKIILQASKIRIFGEDGENYKILCPNPLHREKNPSCYIRKDNGLFFCHGCHANNDMNGRGNLYQFLRLIGRDDLIKMYCKYTSVDIDIKEVLRDKINQMNQKEPKNQKAINIALPEAFTQNFKGVLGAKYLKYLRHRGLRRSTIRSCKLGYVHNDQIMGRRIIIPIYENGKLVGYQGRAVNKDPKKYKFAKGMDTKKLLYNIDNCNGKEVLVTEGVFDAIMLCQWGYNAVAIFGLYLTPEKVYKIVEKGVERIVFCLDSDKPAQNALESMYKEVYPFFDKIYNIHLPPGKDVDELEKPIFDSLYDHKMTIKRVINSRIKTLK